MIDTKPGIFAIGDNAGIVGLGHPSLEPVANDVVGFHCERLCGWKRKEMVVLISVHNLTLAAAVAADVPADCRLCNPFPSLRVHFLSLLFADFDSTLGLII